jgi:hypothetical protein
MVMAVRSDVAATSVSANGDVTHLSVDGDGKLWVNAGAAGAGLTDAELRAVPVPVSGTFYQATQPVSGPLTDTELRATAVPVSDGGGTISVDDGLGSLTVDGTVAVSAVAGSVAVTGPLTDTQLRASVVPISDGGGSVTVDGTVAVSGVSGSVAVTGPLTDTQLRAVAVPVSGTFWQAAQPITDNGGSLTVDGTVAASNLPTTVDTNSGVKSASTVRMVLATDQPQLTNALKVDGSAVTQPVSGTFWQATQPVSVAATLTTKEVRAATPAQSSVSVTTSSTSILASNSNRLGATIWNEGAQIAYVKLGATASTTSYSVQLATGAYYEVPFNYTGAIDGITSTSTAQLRITEMTA